MRRERPVARISREIPHGEEAPVVLLSSPPARPFARGGHPLIGSRSQAALEETVCALSLCFAYRSSRSRSRAS
ncbi:hypothetical protein BN873_950034 [Candidatus Competibacter denitrificans Run_A_D11]|uniref:Uncharacterized protein n=1 Tax=Candidatus Competibacter denitrificans Run_A_D11 TaxID=1400863 RepID=W6M8P3_9GAMM|nr:hypothetical protein BN873_950034 [Candidatus Competibacter denitrificans Run_A_D11]